MRADGLVAGVDGGNSKTAVVLCDTAGQVVTEITGPGTNCIRDGVPQAARAVLELIETARAEARVGPGPLAAASFQLANVDTAHIEAQMLAFVNESGVASHVRVSNDTFAVLRAGSPQGWGVAVVSGAGVNACGVAPDGRVERFLGLGDISGDWGGGAAIAVAAIGAAVRAGDGRGPGTALRHLIPSALGTASVEQAAVAWSEHRLSMDALHALPPVVAVAADQGDAVASSIIGRQADEIIDMVRALLDRLDLLAEAAPVVLGGGTLQHGPDLLLHRITTGVAGFAPAAEVRLLDTRPVAGSVMEALEAAGALTPELAAIVSRTLAQRATVVPA